MKKLLLPLLLMLFQFGYGQTNYYTFNADSLYSERSVRSAFETVVKSLPKNYLLKPTIYHRIIKKDSIINYLEFQALKSDSSTDNKFEVTFKQDSLFLLLNKKLPQFKLRDLNGNEFSSTQLIGKPSLINLWAIACKPCVEEIPKLNELKERYGDKMNFVAITENTCAKDDLKNFLIRKPFNFEMLENGEEYKKTLKIPALPRNIFVDKEGFIRYIQRNYPFDINRETGETIYPVNNYFLTIIEELIKNNS
ncbi:TlpA family protein disulfide reductase [Solitalea koreensis]|uniref:Thiol-disulfide isomerase or thioredoxin n=1 Tax=Solitalea koreensis TaxID=543615 RepID=A0A521C243_9SPHI|nr:TlpA disulfide reductase family protein [Solitalea koreensis]SMO53469.1 Thiol-disulfide isomerase or thioredoxin [Solitalea koreensis]